MTERNASADTGLPDLPVMSCIPELQAALKKGHAVLSAAPGSGKTTLVPLLLRDEDWLQGRRILLLEPRRPAARMAARRMSALIGQSVGEEVGYQVRFERKLSSRTRIEVLTEGLLVRRLQNDPELDGIGLVIFDEFHERHIQTDLSLALCLDVAKGLRDDLRLLVMSATLDPGPLCGLLSGEAVAAPGREHPVSCEFDVRDCETREVVMVCVRLATMALEETSGDVLVFLPGRREIDRFVEEARASFAALDLAVLSLHGGLDGKAQDAVLQGGDGARRRLIAATDLAETSLTIDGLTAVVDSGLARRPRFDGRSGMTRLETRRISQASATQRAGRAGRLGPGRAYRAWTQERHARLETQSRPEILDAELSPARLEIAAWGATPQTLDWIDVPPDAAWSAATDLLWGLGALAANGVITEQGQAMARLPIHPRLARLLACQAPSTDPRLAIDVAALLSERDPLRGADRKTYGADLRVRLDLLREFRAGRAITGGVDRAALRNLLKACDQLEKLISGRSERHASGQAIDSALLRAYPDRIAQLVSTDGRRYRLRNGRAATLHESDPLIGSPFLVIPDLDLGEREGRIFLAVPLARATIEAELADAIEDRRELRWDEAIGDVVARRIRAIDAIVLDDQAVSLRVEDDLVGVLSDRVAGVGLDALVQLPESYLARVALMRRLEPEQGWPDLSVEGLSRNLAAWLGPWLDMGGVRALRKRDPIEMLRAHLGHELATRLERELPMELLTPAGTRRRIHYKIGAEPVLALPMQEMFGEEKGPRLAAGRIELVLHLLSPAGRPLQITRDLAAFWQGAYEEVKKEMRGRYPKHYWPDHPAAATAGRSLKRSPRK